MVASKKRSSGRALRPYHQKRDFAITPEPRGTEAGNREGRLFVIQKHAARALHYDFRLELEGVLKSWAVPKGPSLDPADKRLAMQTEDHPLEYGDFEGIIPKGQYGGGTVLLWDHGPWLPAEDPHKGYRAGKLKFQLQGEKLGGGWSLVRIRARDRTSEDRTWLLIKEQDAAARRASGYSIVDDRPESVATGRTLEQIAADRGRVWESNRPERETRGRRSRGGIASNGTASGEIAGGRTAGSRSAAMDSGSSDLGATGPAAGRSSGTPGTESRTATRAAAARPSKRQAAALKLPSLEGARKRALPAFEMPQQPTLVSAPPPGDEWLHEMKYDGYRILCRVSKGKAKLLSRNGSDWTEKFPSVARAAEALSAEALLDGEVAALQPDGKTSFQALQNVLSGDAGNIVYFLFDLLYLDGYDLREVPLEQRKELLHVLLKNGAAPSGGVLRYSDHVLGQGEDFFRQACRMALEGVVSKRRDARYESGRSRAWLKVKCVQEQEVVIGGFTEPAGSRVGLGALLVGVHEGDRLRYVGKVGTGYSDKMLKDLRRRLGALQRKTSPFAGPVPAASRARWVAPKLVAQVRFTEWTRDGKLRHPSFEGLRLDKAPGDVVREKPRPISAVASSSRRRSVSPRREAGPGRRVSPPSREPAAASRKAATARRKGAISRKAATARRRAATSRKAATAREIRVAGVRLTHPDRVLYPEQGITKHDLALFYESIAKFILPHLQGRPLSLVRCPEGRDKGCFYMKHAGAWGVPDALRRVPIQEKSKIGEYLIVDSLPALIGLVQMGILEIHTWNAVYERLERPDRVVFDLDPGPGVSWERVIEAAQTVRKGLSTLDLESFVKTTGGKGLHVVVPLTPVAGWDECFDFSRRFVEAIVTSDPRSYTSVMSKARRKEKIFIDYFRNNRGATSVAAYSTRIHPGAPVSTPLTWTELRPSVRSDQYNVLSLPLRLAALSKDPWAAYWKTRQRLPGSSK